MIKKNKKTLKKAKIDVKSLAKQIQNDVKSWSKSKDGRNYKLFYQLEQLR